MWSKIGPLFWPLTVYQKNDTLAKIAEKSARFWTHCCNIYGFYNLGDEKSSKEPDLDPYIILLVRDPRGIFNSRAKIFTSDKYIQQGRGRNYDELAHNIQTLCNQTQTMLDDIGRWPDLRAKTLTVRYEDLASNPLKQDGECTGASFTYFEPSP